jgi:hypothetical protein
MCSDCGANGGRCAAAMRKTRGPRRRAARRGWASRGSRSIRPRGYSSTRRRPPRICPGPAPSPTTTSLPLAPPKTAFRLPTRPMRSGTIVLACLKLQILFVIYFILSFFLSFVLLLVASFSLVGCFCVVCFFYSYCRVIHLVSLVKSIKHKLLQRYFKETDVNSGF